jgi:hypothetical protein
MEHLRGCKVSPRTGIVQISRLHKLIPTRSMHWTAADNLTTDSNRTNCNPLDTAYRWDMVILHTADHTAGPRLLAATAPSVCATSLAIHMTLHTTSSHSNPTTSNPLDMGNGCNECFPTVVHNRERLASLSYANERRTRRLHTSHYKHASCSTLTSHTLPDNHTTPCKHLIPSMTDTDDRGVEDASQPTDDAGVCPHHTLRSSRPTHSKQIPRNSRDTAGCCSDGTFQAEGMSKDRQQGCCVYGCETHHHKTRNRGTNRTRLTQHTSLDTSPRYKLSNPQWQGSRQEYHHT